MKDGEEYRNELQNVLSNDKYTNIYKFILNSEQEWVPLNQIENNFDNKNIMTKLVVLQDVYLIREKSILSNSGIQTVYTTDVILPGCENIINEYI